MFAGPLRLQHHQGGVRTRIREAGPKPDQQRAKPAIPAGASARPASPRSCRARPAGLRRTRSTGNRGRRRPSTGNTRARARSRCPSSISVPSRRTTFRPHTRPPIVVPRASTSARRRPRAPRIRTLPTAEDADDDADQHDVDEQRAHADPEAGARCFADLGVAGGRHR